MSLSQRYLTGTERRTMAEMSLADSTHWTWLWYMTLNQGVEQLFRDWLFRALCTANFWPHRSDNRDTLVGH